MKSRGILNIRISVSWNCTCNGGTIGENKKYTLQAGVFGLVNQKERVHTWDIGIFTSDYFIVE